MARHGTGAGLLMIGAAIAAFLILGSAQATPVDAPEDPNAPDLPPTSPDTTAMNTPTDQAGNNALDAFLYVIRSCENRQVIDSDRYFRFYGNATFSGTADHPAITGECKPVSLDSLGARYKGLVSTAAGAYQINRPTWLRVRNAGAWGAALGDFSPDSQDEAAIRLLAECGALDAINAGDIPGALAKASKLWASLPGSTAGQSPVTLDTAIAFFNDGLATFA